MERLSSQATYTRLDGGSRSTVSTCGGSRSTVSTCGGSYSTVSTCGGSRSTVSTCGGSYSTVSTCGGGYSTVSTCGGSYSTVGTCGGSHSTVSTCGGGHSTVSTCGGSSNGFSGSNSSGEIMSLQREQVDDVMGIMRGCIDQIEMMAEDLVRWDAVKYASVPSKYAHMYPNPRYSMSRIDDCVDSISAMISRFNSVVEEIEGYANGGSGEFGSGGQDAVGIGKPGQFNATLNNDGTYSDAGGSLYVKVGDDFINVVSKGNGVFGDDSGNKYLAIDTNGDGVAESFVKLVDTNGDGILEGPNGEQYVGMDADNDGKLDTYVKATDDDKDGVFTDEEGNTYTPVDTDNDGTTDSYIKQSVKNTEDQQEKETIVSTGTPIEGQIVSTVLPPAGGPANVLELIDDGTPEVKELISGVDEEDDISLGDDLLSESSTSLSSSKPIIPLLDDEEVEEKENIKSSSVGVGAAVVGGVAALGGSIYGGASYYKKQKGNVEDDDIEDEEQWHNVPEEEKTTESPLNALAMKEQLLHLEEDDY